jgi:hypothetical protein
VFGSIGLFTVTMVPSGLRTFTNLYPGGGTGPGFAGKGVPAVGAGAGGLEAETVWLLGSTTGGTEVVEDAAVLAMSTKQTDQMSRTGVSRPWASQAISNAPVVLLVGSRFHSSSAPTLPVRPWTISWPVVSRTRVHLAAVGSKVGANSARLKDTLWREPADSGAHAFDPDLK